MFKKMIIVLQISLLALLCCFGLTKEAYASDDYKYTATVSGDFFYVRDSSGNVIPGEIVSDKSVIAIIDISYSKQLIYTKYLDLRAGGIEKRGYIKNVPSLLQYNYQDRYQNGSTSEPVYDHAGNRIGSLDPWEKATPIYSIGNMLHVVYNTDKGKNTKSGFVKYWGGFSF